MAKLDAMSILLTGSTGFVGKHVRSMLGNETVMCLDRSHGMDLMNPDSYRSRVLAIKPRYCLHLAWNGIPDYSEPVSEANAQASINLIEILKEAGCRKIVGAGSCWEYYPVDGPVSEGDYLSLNPFSVAKNKVSCALRHSGIPYRWARLFYIFGPGQKPGSLIPSLQTAYAEGHDPVIRKPSIGHDFIHVLDASRILISMLKQKGKNGAFNVGSGKLTSVAEVANILARKYERHAPFPYPPSPTGFYADMTKTKRVFDIEDYFVGIDE